MKAILEFNLPEDNLEYLQVVKAKDMALALWQITHNLKKVCEYKIIEPDNEDVYAGIDLVYKGIYEILESYNIDTNELQ